MTPRTRPRRPAARVRGAAIGARGAAAAVLAAALALAAPAGAEAPAGARGPAVSGRVVGEGGAPLAGAAVALYPHETVHAGLARRLAGPDDPPAAAAARTGEDGRFRLAAPEAGMWVLSVAAPGRASAESELTPLLADEELGDLALPPAEEVRIEVRDAAGRPMAGARVEGREGGAPWRPVRSTLQPPLHRARTGADGRAAIHRAMGADLEVVAVAPGTSVSDPVAVSGGGATVVLAEGRARTVRVTRSGGEPAEGAVVAAGRAELPVGRAGADGTLAVRQRPGEKLLLTVHGLDGTRARATLQPIAQPVASSEERMPQTAAPVAVELPVPWTVVGRALAEPGREPVAGAWVWPARDPARHVRADAGGRFSLVAPLAELPVGAAAFGYGSAFGSAARDRGTVTLLLPAHARLAGRVVDEEDRPVLDAEVTARSLERPWLRVRSAPTDRGGRFEIAVETGGGAYVLRAERAGWAPAERIAGAPPAGEVEGGLRLVLRRGRTAHGRVLDEADEPVAGARVLLSPSPEGMDVRRWMLRGEPAGPQTTTDPEGRFAVRDLGGGRYDLAVEAAGFAPAIVPGIAVPEGAGEADLGTVILAPGRRVAGRVVDPDGGPMEGAKVQVHRPRQLAFRVQPADEAPAATSAADGWFEVGDLAAGQPVDLVVARPGYTAATVPGVTPPVDEPLEVVLRPTVTMHGTVVGPGGEPIEGATLMARPTNPFITGRYGGGRQAMGTSDERGEFEIVDVEPGEVLLVANAEGYQQREIAGIVLAPGRDHEGVRVELQPGGTVRGTVRGPDGEPVDGTRVEVEQEQNPLRFQRRLGARTDAEGRYEVAGVPPGRRTLSAFHPEHVRAVRELEITLGESRLDFRLERGYEVRGRVLDTAGAPVPGARVSLVTDARIWTSRGEASGEDGSFTLAGVEAGTYRARAERQGYAEALSEPIAVAGPVDGLELRLERGAAIVGTVVGAGPDELADLRVFAHLQEAGRRGAAMAPVDYEGRFRLEGIVPGDWMVTATVGVGGRSAFSRVEVEPGAVEVPVTIELTAGLTLEGEVLARGEPLPGMMVAAVGTGRMSGGMATSDHRGAFRIEGLEPGVYRLQVFRSGSALQHSEELTIEADRAVTVEIDPAAIRGRVTDAADGAPLEGAKVRVEASRTDSFGEFGQILSLESTTAPDGTFRIAEISPGGYDLVASADGYRSARRPVELPPGGEVAGVDLELERSAAELELEVRAARGGTPESVVVVVLPAGGVGGQPRPVVAGRQPVGAGGRVRVDGLAPGSWDVLVGALGTATVRVRAALPGPPVAVTLPPPASLTVRVPALADTGALGEARVIDAAGRPWSSPDFLGRLRETFDLGRGEARLPDLPPGTWTVVVTVPDGRTWTGQATLAPGETQDLILD